MTRPGPGTCTDPPPSDSPRIPHGSSRVCPADPADPLISARWAGGVLWWPTCTCDQEGPSAGRFRLYAGEREVASTREAVRVCAEDAPGGVGRAVAGFLAPRLVPARPVAHVSARRLLRLGVLGCCRICGAPRGRHRSGRGSQSGGQRQPGPGEGKRREAAACCARACPRGSRPRTSDRGRTSRSGSHLVFIWSSAGEHMTVPVCPPRWARPGVPARLIYPAGALVRLLPPLLTPARRRLRTPLRNTLMRTTTRPLPDGCGRQAAPRCRRHPSPRR